MSRLRAHVHVTDDSGDVHVFGPDDQVPDWAAALMGAHCFQDGVHPHADSEAEAGPVAPADGEGTAGGPPPKAGPGASKDAWTAYAESLDVDITDCGTRDELIAAVAAAGHPVE